ncbi:MAG: hypothetical protein LBH68_01820 [Bifidobacteriaceae bacterium]|jgi:hypothetical protein|nr:hypothetical protein [Bifidobacteriaceae bacterium]
MGADSIDVLGGTAGNISCMEDLDRLAERLDNARWSIRQASREMMSCEVPWDDGIPQPRADMPSNYPSLRNSARQAVTWELQRLIPSPPFGYCNGAIDSCGPLRDLNSQLVELADKVRTARANYEEAERSITRTMNGWQTLRANLLSSLASSGPFGHFVATAGLTLGLLAEATWSLRIKGGLPCLADMVREHHPDLRALLGPLVNPKLRFSPASTQEVTRGITGMAAAFLGDGLWVTATKGATYTDSAIGGVEAMIDRIMNVSGGDPDRTDISITKITDCHGNNSWLVAIPGTESMTMGNDSNASDNGTNLRAITGDPNAIGIAVTTALRDAGIKSDEPVVLAGYSQGGIVSAALAADNGFTSAFNVTAVLTAGSPVALLKPARNSQWLSLEHVQDVVPVLDGKPNPHTAKHTTVVRDLSPKASTFSLDDPLEAHHLPEYARTAALVDSSKNASLNSWKAAAAPIFDPGATVETTVYTVERHTSPPRILRKGKRH